jgi:sugar lactone lactonase YvrE
VGDLLVAILAALQLSVSSMKIGGNTLRRIGRGYGGMAAVAGLLFFVPWLEAQSGSRATAIEFTTLAGLAGNSDSTDATGSTARFNNPNGVAVDASGNAYVADTRNHTIRKITPGGVVTTWAGSAGNAGSADGTGSAARFHGPHGVAVDASGTVYVADSGNSTIRKINPGGVVTTWAGSAGNPGSDNGTGSAARFNTPTGVGVDASGNVYVADTCNQTIRKVTPGGVVTTWASSAGNWNWGSNDGTGSVAKFWTPIGVAVDASRNVYVADTYNDTIRKITPDRVVTTLAGLVGHSGSADGTGSATRFHHPQGVAVDASGTVYVADTRNDTIRKITPGGAVTTLAGLAGHSGSADGTGSATRFLYPSGVAVDASGTVYVADCGNHAIRKITPDGVVTTLAGLALNSGSANGTGSAARFYQPRGVAVDAFGTVYVADTYNHTIREYQPSCFPKITTQPQNQTVTAGTSVSFSVMASGVPVPTYQWQMCTDGGTVWSNLSDGGNYSGATTATLTVTGVTVAMNGSKLVCEAANSFGTFRSTTAMLTVP